MRYLAPVDSKAALLQIGRTLARAGYRFVTTTPKTHERVITRRKVARDLRDVFGFSLPFELALLGEELCDAMRAADALAPLGNDMFRSRVRFSSLGAELYVHSAFPTLEADSVFFGPDTYRFCAFLEREAPRARNVIDIGAGSGAGGLVAARAAHASRLVLADINARALHFASVNAALQERPAECVHSDVFAGVSGLFDLIVANPPYMRDAGARAYRDGGGEHGEALSVRIVREALGRLAPGGTLLLYTGAAIVDGEDRFRVALDLNGFEHRYQELDPDVFGEELEQPGYERVERIAAVALTVRAEGGERLASADGG